MSQGSRAQPRASSILKDDKAAKFREERLKKDPRFIKLQTELNRIKKIEKDSSSLD